MTGHPVSPSERLRAAIKAADEKLACMWSNDEEHRANLMHTCAVEASEILRAALAESVPVEPPRCHAGCDGDCSWNECPQMRDGEPRATGRHCPLDLQSEDEW